jgi:phosphatidylethanolamine/phosphatidyl-N-methylethanolamine N-methyltransferase
MLDWTGPLLARAVAARIDPHQSGPVVVLWPGLGAMTTALVERGVHPARLLLVEADPFLCASLRRRLPAARVVQTDAYAAPGLLRRLPQPAAAIVSGTPLMLRPAPQRLRLVLGCLRAATPGALFVQIAGFSRSPIPVARPGLRARGTGLFWPNLWPTTVWTYRLACHGGAMGAVPTANNRIRHDDADHDDGPGADQ